MFMKPKFKTFCFYGCTKTLQCSSCSEFSIWFQTQKARRLESFRPVESMVGLEVRSQVDQMFVDGEGLEFMLPPGIEFFFWIFFQEYYPL